MKPLIAAVLLVAGGFPFAFLLTRRWLLAGLLAPLVAGVTAGLAVVGMLATEGSLRVWLVAALAAQWVLVAGRLRRPRSPLPYSTWADVLCYVLPLGLPALLVLAPPVQWDAHSIWWTHAAYFVQGGEFARQDMSAFAYHFSHPDYPPLASAAVAGAWSVLPGFNFGVAQVVSTVLNLSAIGTLAYAVRSVTGRAPVALSRVAAVAVALAAWGTAPYAVAGGYSDQLWAAAVVGAAALLLLGDQPMARPGIPVLLLTVAALSKNEALVPVLAVALLVTLRERRNLRPVWPVWPPVFVGAGWMLFARALGANSDVTTNTGVSGLLTGDKGVLDRFPPTFQSMWSAVDILVLTAAAVALLGWAALRRRREALGIGSDLWLWSLAVIYAVSLIFVYVTSTGVGLAWYLMTSIDRVTVPIELLACLSAVCWCVSAVARGQAPDVGRDQPVDADLASDLASPRRPLTAKISSATRSRPTPVVRS
jgi:hypothetical protein